MTGQLSESTRDPFTKVSSPKASDQASIISHRAELPPEAVKNSDLPNTAFGPDPNHGSHPAQYTNRSSTSLAAGSTPPILSPPVLEENPYTPPAIPMNVSTNAENVLPSPSPSVEVRQNSVNVVELEDEGPPPIEVQMATLEEIVTRCGGIDQFERLLKDAGKSNYGPSQIAASAIAPELPGANSSSDPRRQERSGSKNQSRSESEHGIPAPINANKRPQEVTNEPRKRLQSLPGSSFGYHFRIPLATTVPPPPCKNLHSSAVASPSAIEMRLFSHTLTDRMQLVANLPDREGSHVERPRLGLLREACENSDHFYLVLHQLFCFDDEVRRSKGQTPGLNELQRKGLDVVAFLLVPNEKMVDNAVSWFSIFPLPGASIMKKPEFISAHSKVLRCLEKMATFWADMRSKCTKRMYPPLVDELVVLFNVESFLFQQIIFRAVLRDIWPGKLDHCFHISEEVFNRDYKEVMSRLLISSTSVEKVKLYQQAIIREYQLLLGSHWQHTVAGPTANMAPPRQQQSQFRLASAEHCSNNRNMSQSEHNKNAQSPLTLDLRAAQRHSLSEATGPVPIAIQAVEVSRQGNLPSQSQTLASDTYPSSHISSFTQSPPTFHGYFGPGATVNLHGQWNGQQHQGERRTSSTVGDTFGPPNNLHNTPESMTPNQRTPRMALSNVPGNPHMHQLQQTIGLPQQLYNRVPPSNIANPRPHPQPELRRSLSNHASETSLPALSPRSSMHSSPTLSTHANPTPFVRSYPALPNHPNPATSALHQAHLRSPILSYFDLKQNSNSVAKCYRFINKVLMPPEELDSNSRHVNWDFSVNKEFTDSFARDANNSHGAPPTRAIVPGSRLCRIRCISLNKKAGMPTESEWAVADIVWPGSTAVVLNGIALDIRKKSHHGKDLPIDVTSYVKEGQNNLSTAIIGFQKDCTTRYAIGVEFILVVDEQMLKNQITVLPLLEARKRILDQSKNLDPDIEVIQAQKVLDLTDPFTASMFEVPVRGINCHHNQCFDCYTFLQTRTAKVPGEPCGPDEFRCPICGQDARPQSLMIDSFFLDVRTELKEKGRLDSKAIILDDSGKWEIKEEEEVTGESGDGTGKRSAGLAAAGTASTSTARQSAPREVIELDDD